MLKKILSAIIVSILALSLFAFAACENTESSSSAGVISMGGGSGSENDDGYEYSDPVTDDSIIAEAATGEFSIETEDGVLPEPSGGVYTITAAGTYSLKGYLKGQIIVDAGDEDKVVLELNGVTIECDLDSPVKILSADKVEISAKKETENIINDLRAVKTSDDDSQGKGAIYAKADLKFKGAGVLVVNGNYNNGIHTTKDLEIQKLSLKVTAYNNAIKGNDSVTVTSGAIVAISTNGDGVKTESTDADKNGNVRGDITISGGSIAVYAAGDGIQAAHDFVCKGEDGSAPTIVIYTGSYSGYTAAGAAVDSYKGVKAENELNISAGAITVRSYDDGLHANYGATFEAGGNGLGNINISGGTINVSVYSPDVKTGGGFIGPRTRQGQQSVKGADGIHADSELNIFGGEIFIDSSYEGLEGNVINVSGGKTTVIANDDGVNACSGTKTPVINVSGGYLDVAVSPNGDTDGIDSNGSYYQTGGVVITRGPSSAMAAALDVDERGTAVVSGGTLIVLGYASIRTSGSVKSVSLSLNFAGSHTVTIGGTAYTFNNAYSYARTNCYSSETVK